MVQILNNFLTTIYDALLKYHESKLEFRKQLLDIKIDELNNKTERKIERVKLITNHKLAKYEISAGIESEYVKEIITEKTRNLEEKIYWKKRIIKQKIKRSKSDEKTQKLKKQLKDLEQYKINKIKEIKDKYINKDITEAAKKDYDIKRQELITKRDEKINILKTKRDKKIHKLTTITNSQIENHKTKIKDYNQKLNALEEEIKTKADTTVLNKDIVLSLRDLSMHFGGLKAVDKLSFDVKKGEIFGLIGPNGAGKTTVFNCITRFYKPTSGDMYFNNLNGKTVHLNNIKVHNIIKQGIVRTFQNVELVWELNIIDNLLVAAHSTYRSNFFGHVINSRLTKREEEIFTKKALKILSDLGLTQYTYAFPIGLPYGILKKVELARTLMSNPNLIILDEPAAGLNESETKELADIIHKIKKQYNVTVFLVEHDMGLVMDICDTVCAISFG
ncbi:MAG: ATP-binding cassette domain-containing protein, partial [Candidatus Izimaplasma sp.]|nr:ATP-binding cassette domain-containing protein [Candidatus Izimaplasma bacterium]